MTASNTPPRGRRAKDLTGIRPKNSGYQVRIRAGLDPVTGRSAFLYGAAPDEASAIRMRDKFRNEVAEDKAASSQATFAYLLRECLDAHPADPDTVANYRFLAETFVIPALGSLPLTRLARHGPRAVEKFYAELRRCRRRCDGRPFTEHRKGCDGAGRCDKRCYAHECKPASEATIRKIHAVCNIACKAGVRWGLLGVNPMEATLTPPSPKPRPNPPSPANAARIVEEAISMDENWGAFVWLTMVTGARRGELVPLRFQSVHLICAACSQEVEWGEDVCANTDCNLEFSDGDRTATLDIRSGFSRRREKGTKTDQIRRIALDATTTDILLAHWYRYVQSTRLLGGEPRINAYLFSYAPDNGRPCDPDGLTHKYSRMTAKLGLDTHLHELRHYSATELLTAGVDLRTVAGRLGHAGGGATTLKFYAAWVPTADEKAAAIQAARLLQRRSSRKTD